MASGPCQFFIEWTDSRRVPLIAGIAKADNCYEPFLRAKARIPFYTVNTLESGYRVRVKSVEFSF
jgi:hypothetical protein